MRLCLWQRPHTHHQSRRFESRAPKFNQLLNQVKPLQFNFVQIPSLLVKLFALTELGRKEGRTDGLKTHSLWILQHKHNNIENVFNKQFWTCCRSLSMRKTEVTDTDGMKLVAYWSPVERRTRTWCQHPLSRFRHHESPSLSFHSRDERICK